MVCFAYSLEFNMVDFKEWRGDGEKWCWGIRRRLGCVGYYRLCLLFWVLFYFKGKRDYWECLSNWMIW